MTLEVKNKTMTSAAQCMFALLQYTDKKYLTLSEVMGYSAHAFRINIHPESVSPAGPTMFAPYELVSKSLQTIGLHTLTITDVTPLSDKSLADAIRMAQGRIDMGVPIISWDLFAPEFGIIYGYDHERQEFYAKDVDKDGAIKYTELNNRRFNNVFICGFYESIPKSIPIMLRDALRKIIEHAHGKSPFASYDYKHGLAGYSAWIQAFQSQKMDVFGNSYNTAIVADARQHAYLFFSELILKWRLSTDIDKQVLTYLEKAKALYFKVAECFQQLQKMFPFPNGGTPNDPTNSAKAIQILRNALEWETKGVETLEILLDILLEYEDETFMQPVVQEKTFQFAGEKHKGKFEDFEIEIPNKMLELMKKEEGIVSRIITIRLAAYEPQTRDREEGAFIVARPVSFEPYDLPRKIKYYKITNKFASIRGIMKEKPLAYEKLMSWMNENGHVQNMNEYCVERVKQPQFRGGEDEVEIFIPLV
ncbi:hypothetical protein [Sutcliffiella rhizosphaerae]|uniref:Bacterial transcription activator effector binding domain-containing protein n=1 Tax=Sutcliffiella rhizosphaerae TaxID=2880967 RepID=A0ABN8ABJ7_9BACI|nr:hypothetical protein [Sutcliffiella rhizosphaerae]CAG9622561.1 hypothetical protein BACCIP111883_03352 [Sutcliffiella rhizosphaerae]